MGQDAAEIRKEFHPCLGEISRELKLEDVAGALGDETARQLIELSVQEQADDWPEEELGECLICGGAARKAPDQPRVLTTTRGSVEWKQRVTNCPRCRRAFLPSEPSISR